MPWRRLFQPIVWPLYQIYSCVFRGVTLGVRGLVLNQAGEVLLVEHTYMPGWYLPGGGVEPGETTQHALIRELQEEAGVQVVGRPLLVGIHANHRVFRGDHVLLYRIDNWTPCAATQQGEIKAVAWCAPDQLPADVSPGTRRRIVEALGGAEASLHW
jgi:8-oxo-dGTP pyrophosphatase MutT (NUDIX family)